MRETAFLIRLEGERTSPDMPRAVRQLSPQKEANAFQECRVTCRDPPGRVESDESLARRVGITLERRELTPPSFGPLRGEQCIASHPEIGSTRLRPGQTQHS